MINLKYPLLTLACSLALVACNEKIATDIDNPTQSVSETQSTATSSTTDAPSPPPRPPAFHEMLDTIQLRAEVVGAKDPLIFNVAETKFGFTEAEKYVSDKSSYAFLIWHDGKLIHEEYYEPHSADLRPESASMHKTVAALAVGAAIDKGYIDSVEDTIDAYFPEWGGQDRGKITIRNLLEMNSGLESLSYEGGASSPAMTFWMVGAQARPLMMGLDLKHSPGEVFNYANVNTQMLSHIIETSSGVPYHEFLSEHIWKPIEADSAFVWLNEPDGFARTYSSLFATAQDWLKVGLLIKDLGKFNGTQVVSEEFVSRLVSPTTTNSNYGWQVWLGSEYEPMRYYSETKTGAGVAAGEPFEVDDLVYLDGFGGQRVYISRSLDLVIVRTGDVAMDWDDSALPNAVISALK